MKLKYSNGKLNKLKFKHLRQLNENKRNYQKKVKIKKINMKIKIIKILNNLRTSLRG